ncbi:glycosyltransferase [Microbacterium sp. NPDC056044]|uniref:glycosyltransferase n=1 Tax=Microbacterium sp. NPDC056044 TaxID=3345690 RepID=UPI0035E34C20
MLSFVYTGAVSSRLIVYPMYVSNPYLTMAHVAPVAAGWSIIGVRSVADLDDAVDAGDVVHIHWTAPVLQAAADRDVASAKVDEFVSILDRLKSRGAKLLWTVHNEIAHDTPWPEFEVRIAEALADRSDAIIQLHDHTADAVSASYTLPAAKLVTLRHSSYLGIYGHEQTAPEARKELGIEAGHHVVGFVGQLRRYKGIGTLCAAVDVAVDKVSDLTLLVAGAARHGDSAWLKEVMPKRARTVRWNRRVPDRTLANWVCAADIIALPYQRVLNSGSLLLAATYGRPVIIPSNTALASVYSGESWVHTYDADTDDVSPLAESIISALGTARSDSDAARQYARDWTPYDMSRAYLRILERVANA